LGQATRISATVITLNEARNIDRCLASLKGIADEIIVLDAFSTDATAEICAAHGATFVQRAWEGYAASKNHLNSLTQYNYILSLDADEAVSPELKASILQARDAGLEGTYELNRRTNYCGKWIYHSGWYPDIKPRLFQKQNCSWQGAYVHEELVCADNSVKTLLNGDLYHYSYYSYTDHRARADKYSLLTARKFSAQGKQAGILKPYVSAIARFISMYFIKRGFLDGWMGFKIAQISALSNILKYKELRRLNHEQKH
jgi:glycosyltransferase involved in cell wall biosynthesis